jgi:hypothetical protein
MHIKQSRHKKEQHNSVDYWLVRYDAMQAGQNILYTEME